MDIYDNKTNIIFDKWKYKKIQYFVVWSEIFNILHISLKHCYLKYQKFHVKLFTTKFHEYVNLHEISLLTINFKNGRHTSIITSFLRLISFTLRVTCP